MIRDMIDFFRKEKFYSILTILLALGLILVSVKAKNMPSPKENDQVALQEFKKVEENFQQKMKNPQEMQKFMADNPVLAITFNAVSIFVFVAFFAGLFLVGKFLFDPKWRESFSIAPGIQMTDWQLGMVYKVILLFMSGSLLSGIVLGVIRKFFLSEMSENAFLLFHTTITDVLIFAIIYYVITKAKGDWRDIGFHPPQKLWHEVKLGLIGYMTVLPIFIGVLLVLILLSNLFSYEPPAHPLVSVFLEEEERSPLLIFYSVFLAAILGPFFEEIFFRGFCYSVFRKRWGIGWASVITAVFFSAIHGNIFAFLPIIVLGLALAWLFEKRGSLVSCMTLHMIHNSVFMAYFFIMKAVIEKNAGH